MKVPRSQGGVVQELRVQLGEKVAEGSLLLTVQEPQHASSGASERQPAAAHDRQTPSAIDVQASNWARTADLECDLLVLGGGPGGYSAAFRAADLGLKAVIVER